MTSDRVNELKEQLEKLLHRVENLLERVDRAEADSSQARREAHDAHELVAALRDEVAAAQRDQQDLRTARARLRRFSQRGLLARILNRD